MAYSTGSIPHKDHHSQEARKESGSSCIDPAYQPFNSHIGSNSQHTHWLKHAPIHCTNKAGDTPAPPQSGSLLTPAGNTGNERQCLVPKRRKPQEQRVAKIGQSDSPRMPQTRGAAPRTCCFQGHHSLDYAEEESWRRGDLQGQAGARGATITTTWESSQGEKKTQAVEKKTFAASGGDTATWHLQAC